MNDTAIEILNEMLLKEHKEGNSNKQYVMNKEELIRFCIKLLKCVDNVKGIWYT